MALRLMHLLKKACTRMIDLIFAWSNYCIFYNIGKRKLAKCKVTWMSAYIIGEDSMVVMTST